MSVLNKRWKSRVKNKACYDWAKEQGYNNFLASLLSSRYSSTALLQKSVLSSIKDMDKPDTLPDILKAANRVADAIQAGEIIGLETDHDCDGVTSHAVIYEALTKIIGYPKEKIRSYIGHRLVEGYGLSDLLVDRILADSIVPTLIITADNGSSDESRIARLKLVGIDTIVTDHHEIPTEGIPQSAYAVVSPAREDSEYPDSLIAGCFVACLTMAMVRKVLIARNYFEQSPPSIGIVFDFVALGTVADCVSMSRSHNNRLMVAHGLKMINQGQRACWRSLRVYVNKDDPNPIFKAEDLGFIVGPRINARGRLDDAMAGVDFLLAKDDETATQILNTLNTDNEERKSIEKRLKDDSLVVAKELIDKGYQSLVVFLPNGHPGVHGIVASRLTEAYGMPTAIISPKGDDPLIVSASARGIEGFHVREALQRVYDLHPDVITKFGGHKGAAGFSLHASKIDEFRDAFDQAAVHQIELQKLEIGAMMWTDGEIPPSLIKMETLEQINQLEPFGREMDPPTFECNLYINNVKRVGRTEPKTHINVDFKMGDEDIKGVWFGACEYLDEQQLKLIPGTTQRFAFSLAKNSWRGKTTLQVMIKDVF